jgi:hypothetical protein
MSGLPQPEPGLLAARAWQVFEHVPRPLDPLLQLGRRWVLPLARYSLPVTLCRGRTPSGEDTSLISIGRGYQHDHVRRQVFDSGPGQESLDPVPLHRVHARLRQALDEADLVAALVPRAIAKMLAGHDFLHLPGLLDFLLPTDDHAFKLASHTIRTDVRRVR